MGLLDALRDAIDPSGRSVQGFLGNVLGSAGDIGEGLLGIGQTVGSDIASLAPGGEPASFGDTAQLAGQLPPALWQHLQQNYLDPLSALAPGGVPAGEGLAQFGQYAYERPADLALDALGVQQMLTPGSLTRRAVGAAGRGVGRGAQAAGRGAADVAQTVAGAVPSEAGAIFPSGAHAPSVRIYRWLKGTDDLADMPEVRAELEELGLADIRNRPDMDIDQILDSADQGGLPEVLPPIDEAQQPGRSFSYQQAYRNAGEGAPFSETDVLLRQLQESRGGYAPERTSRGFEEGEGPSLFPSVIDDMERNYNIPPEETEAFLVSFRERTGRDAFPEEVEAWGERLRAAGAPQVGAGRGVLPEDLRRIRDRGGQQALEAELRRRAGDPRFARDFQGTMHEEFWSRAAEPSGAGPAAQAQDIGIFNENQRIPGETSETTAGESFFGSNWRRQARERYDPLTGQVRPGASRPGRRMDEAADPYLRGAEVNPRMGRLRTAEAADFLTGEGERFQFTPDFQGRYKGPEVEDFVRRARAAGLDIEPSIDQAGNAYITRTQLNAVLKQRRQVSDTIRQNLSNTVVQLRRQASALDPSNTQRRELMRQADAAEDALNQMSGGVRATTKAPATIERQARAAITGSLSRAEPTIGRPSPEIQRALREPNVDELRRIFDKERTGLGGFSARTMTFPEWVDWQESRLAVTPSEMRSWSPEQYRGWVDTRRSAALRGGVSPEAVARNYPDTVEGYLQRQDELAAEYGLPAQVYSEKELGALGKRISPEETRQKSVAERRRQEQRGRQAKRTASREGLAYRSPSETSGQRPLPVELAPDRRAVADVEAPSRYTLEQEGVPENVPVTGADPVMVGRITDEINARLDSGQDLDAIEAELMDYVERGAIDGAAATEALRRIEAPEEGGFFTFTSERAATPETAPVETPITTTREPQNPTPTTPKSYSTTKEQVTAEFVRQEKEFRAGKRDTEPSPLTVAEALSGQKMSRPGKGSTNDPARRELRDLVNNVFVEMGRIEGVRKVAGVKPGTRGRRTGSRGTPRKGRRTR